MEALVGTGDTRVSMSELEALKEAKNSIVNDPNNASKIVQTILPVIYSSSELTVKQWVSEFFNDVFSPEFVALSFHQKQDLSSLILPTLIHLSQFKDVLVYKNVILVFTNIYEMVFDLIAKTSNEQLYKDFEQLKKFILENWNSCYPLNTENNENSGNSSIGAKLATIKFMSKVIIVQSPTQQDLDPRRRRKLAAQPNKLNEISISNISDKHPLIKKINLDAESQGLLDLLINYLNDEEYATAQVFIGILNCLVYILQKRFNNFNAKILNALTNFDINTKYQMEDEKDLRFKLSKRFVNRSLKNVLNYLIKAHILPSQNALYSKAVKIINLIDLKMNEQKKKGILTKLSSDGVPNKKSTRVKQEQEAQAQVQAPPTAVNEETKRPNDSMIADDNTFKSLYRLIDPSNELLSLDVSQISPDILTKIAVTALMKTDREKLIGALSIVSGRYVDLINKATPPPAAAGQAQPAGTGTGALKPEEENRQDDLDNNQILNEDEDVNYIMPEPKALSVSEKKQHLNLIIQNFFKLSTININNNKLLETSMNVNINDEDINSVKISKIAINDWKKNSWLLLLTRLASRGLHNAADKEFSDLIREALFQYVLENIHDRIDIIIEWLNEEWYSEFNKNFNPEDEQVDKEVDTPVYNLWSEKVLDSIIPSLEANDRKIFIRLLSDLPMLSNGLVNRVKSLCIDPGRSTLGFQSLQFLIMFRPPVKRYCIEILKDLYENNDDLKESCLNLLKKYDAEYVKGLENATEK